MAAVCFSENRSIPLAKARAIAAPFTFTGADLKRGPWEGTLRSRLKERCRSRDALMSTMRLRRTQACRRLNPCARMLVSARATAAYARDGVRLTPQPSTRPPCHAPVHDLIMLHMLTSVRSPRASGSREVAASGHTSSRSWAAGDWAGWFGSRGDWMQLVLLCGCVCVARTRRAISTSLPRVQHAMAEVGVCVAPEPHGLGEGSPNACAMVVACTVVGPVAVGCSWARYAVIYTVADHFISLFRLTGAATRLHMIISLAKPKIGQLFISRG